MPEIALPAANLAYCDFRDKSFATVLAVQNARKAVAFVLSVEPTRGRRENHALTERESLDQGAPMKHKVQINMSHPAICLSSKEGPREVCLR